MEVGVRPATPDDEALLADLSAAAIDELRPHRGGEVWYRRDVPDGHLATGAELVLIGEIDGVGVGFAAAATRPTREGTLARCDVIYVLAGAREVGIGEALLEGVIDWARQRGCYGLDSGVLPGDREAKNFFESAGMTARAITVHRAL